MHQIKKLSLKPFTIFDVPYDCYMSSTTYEKPSCFCWVQAGNQGIGLNIQCLNQIKSTEEILCVKFCFLDESRMKVSVSRPNHPEDLKGLSRVVVKPGVPPWGPIWGTLWGTLNIGILIRIKLNMAEMYFQ